MNKKWDSYNIPHSSFPVTEKNPILACLSGDKGDIFPPGFDMHFALELGIVISGKIKHLYRNWENDLDSGKVWYCGIWEPHGWEITEIPYRGIQVYIWPPMLFHLHFPESPDFNWIAPFTTPPDQRPTVLPGGLERLNEFSRKIEKILFGSVPYPGLQLRLQVLETLFDIQTSWTPPPSFVSDRVLPAVCYVKIAKAVEMVFNSHEFISGKKGAEECGMSYNSFNRNFKDSMGINFAEFALCHRLSSAAKEMLETDNPLKSIALNWGFTDPSHFMKCFRSHYLCTPAEYRKKHNPNIIKTSLSHI